MNEPLKQISLRLPHTLVEHIDLHAAEQRLSRSEWLRDAIRAHVDRELNRVQLEAVKKDIVRALDDAKEAILKHITQEIDELVQS